MYHSHATNEQFHSEIKTDMDIERLPSGKFSTNEIVFGLGGMVYNILRLIGQINCKLENSKKRAVERKRIKTVIKDMIMLASKLCNLSVLNFYENTSLYIVHRFRNCILY